MELTAFDDEARGEAEILICTLNIAGRTKANGRQAVRFHCICRCVLFVDLAVSAKWGATMMFGIKAVPKNDLTGTETI